MLEYPRPQFKRTSFYCLNGQWTLNNKPIIVPYPKESDLSMYPIKEHEDKLVYIKEFDFNDDLTDKRLILHFGAVDNKALVYLNDHFIGEHIGGYLAFSFDITDYISNHNILRVEVIDNTDTFYPYGKQSNKPSGMWYTSISGIWKTVWMETVPTKEEIRSIKIETTIDSIDFYVDTDNEYCISITFDEDTVAYISKSQHLHVDLKNIKYQNWTIKQPVLYTVTIKTNYDTVQTYVGIREIGVETINNHKYLCLNKEPIYLNGVLDQGYFSDGIYSPKDTKEYLNDIRRMKELGFNMLRKHIKVEDEAFYYYCDKEGMLVIQDMVNSGDVNFLKNIFLPTIGFVTRNDNINVDEARLNFFIEHSKETIKQLYNHPCIVAWTIYNESWGQQRSSQVFKELKQLDKYRPFDTCSGWYKTLDSDFDSYHIYFRNKVLTSKTNQILFLSEYGGIKRHIEGHTFTKRKANYGYGSSNDEKELTNKLIDMYANMIIPSIKKGLAGSVLTQLSDVEEEENGLYTYDRMVCKINKKSIQELNAYIYRLFRETLLK